MAVGEERADDLKARRAPGRTTTMGIAGFLTFCLLVGAVVLVWNARQPAGCTGGALSCLTAADWGTFIAGVFAPVAFIWLVAAVSIQSQELAEQREELRLTRLEFAENREVMRQQADEARKQAELIDVQTNILKRQDESRQQEGLKQKFADEIQALADLINFNLSDVPLIAGHGKGGEVRETFFNKGAWSADTFILEFEHHLRVPLKDFSIERGAHINPNALRMIELATETSEDIVLLAASLGTAEKAKLERLRILRLAESLRRILADHAEYVATAGQRRVVDALLNRPAPQ